VDLDNILKEIGLYVDNKITKEEQWSEGEWIKYSGPVLSKEEYVEAIKTLLDGWLIFGKKGREFELKFSEFLGKKHGTLTNSGSSANLLMVSALTSQDPNLDKKYKVKKGDKFITPVVCFPTTLNPLIQNGLEPVFVDVTLPDLNLDLDKVEELLKADTNREIRGIIFAHVLGNPPNMERLMNLVNQYNLIFLEDACDSLGSTYDGKKLGSFGLLSTCSFFPAHHMTMGEGGFIATNSPRLRKILASFRDWGRACYCNSIKPGDVTEETACGDRFGPWLKQVPDAMYDHRYVFDEIGYNLKPLELQASIGLEQLKKLEYLHDKRKENFELLTEVFKKYEKFFILPKATEKADPSWFGFLLTLKDDCQFTRTEFMQFLERNKIQTRAYFTGNCLYHPAYEQFAKKYTDLKSEFPVAHKSTFDTLFLGTYAGITEEKIKYIDKIVNKFLLNKGLL